MSDTHLARAREYLAIAESKDSKREAYKAAAEEIAAYKEETGESIRKIALSLARDDSLVGKLLKWRESGYKADTPYLMDEQATARAALSHTKRVLAEASPEQLRKLVSELPPERRMDLASAITAPPETVGAPGTMAHATQVPEVQMRQAATRSKFDRMKDITSGIRAIASMDVEEFTRHHNWEFDSEHAPSLRTIGRELDAAINKLQTLRDRITARLLEVNG